MTASDWVGALAAGVLVGAGWLGITMLRAWCAWKNNGRRKVSDV